ncbi:hypothetical protein AVEN_233817-1, partial [Araneus ventricosus]
LDGHNECSCAMCVTLQATESGVGLQCKGLAHGATNIAMSSSLAIYGYSD